MTSSRATCWTKLKTFLPHGSEARLADSELILTGLQRRQSVVAFAGGFRTALGTCAGGLSDYRSLRHNRSAWIGDTSGDGRDLCQGRNREQNQTGNQMFQDQPPESPSFYSQGGWLATDTLFWVALRGLFQRGMVLEGRCLMLRYGALRVLRNELFGGGRRFRSLRLSFNVSSSSCCLSPSHRAA